jgi:hypothetical protein
LGHAWSIEINHVRIKADFDHWLRLAFICRNFTKSRSRLGQTRERLIEC